MSRRLFPQRFPFARALTAFAGLRRVGAGPASAPGTAAGIDNDAG